MATVTDGRYWLTTLLTLMLVATTLVAPQDGADPSLEVRGASYATASGREPLAISVPETTKPGDLLVAVVAVTASSATAPGHDWELVRSDSRGGQLTQALWTRRATAEEPAIHKWSGGNRPTSQSGAIFTVGAAGHDQLEELRVVDVGAAAHQLDPIVLSPLDAERDGALLLGAFSLNGEGELLLPGAMADSQASIAGAVTLSTGHETLKAGSTGERIVKRETAGAAVGQLLLVEMVAAQDGTADEDVDHDDGNHEDHTGNEDANHDDDNHEEHTGDEDANHDDDNHEEHTGDDDGHQHDLEGDETQDGGDSESEADADQGPHQPGEQDPAEDSDQPADVVVRGDHPDGFTIPAGQTWEIIGSVTTAANVNVYGALRMRAGSSLTFVEIDEDTFVGPADAKVPIPEDVGLWVLGSGQLDVQGTPKQAWNRTGTHPTWLPSDEYVAAPNHHPGTTPPPEWSYGEPVPCTQFAGESYCTEIANLTRDVVIQGTEGGHSHIFIRSDKPQTVRFAALRFMGPNGRSTAPDGRYALHMHMMHDGSRGSLIEGVVVRDSGDHAFVPHHSNGIHFKDTVAHNVTNTAYWWDPGHETDDTTYERSLAINVQRGRDVGRALNGFRMGMGTGNSCIECVAAGVNGGRPSAGFGWNDPEPNKWAFLDSVSHNNANGVYHWRNEPFAQTRVHEHHGFLSYHNRDNGIEQGAYVIQAQWTDSVVFGNGRHALVNRGAPRGAVSPGITYQRGTLGGQGKHYPIAIMQMGSCPAEDNYILFEDLRLIPSVTESVLVNKSNCDLHGGQFNVFFKNVVVGPEGRDLRREDFAIVAMPEGGKIVIERLDGSRFTIRG